MEQSNWTATIMELVEHEDYRYVLLNVPIMLVATAELTRPDLFWAAYGVMHGN